VRFAQRGHEEVGVHRLAVFGGLHVEGHRGGGGVVDGGVYGDDNCAGGVELGDHRVHDVLFTRDGLVAGGAVEEALHDT
jgi:hypothetical protein